ncbi:hypothetical protein [Acidocella sp.]|uniref:hypothetical protein n=1 Tax=Acidocella sp. TaxID=50710 RepID=UPI00262A8524|nr:hypothetical protein [Acidocella sp.]
MAISLGGVTFRDMEVPEAVLFGGRQDVNVQHLIGGARYVQALGTDDGKIVFSGIFYGGDAIERAQALDLARAQGLALPLAWAGFFYTVIVEQFVAEYRKPTLIPFTISCVVTDDPVADAVGGVGGIATLVGEDLASAAGLAAGGGMAASDFTTPTMAGVGALVGALSGAAAASAGALAAGLADVNNAATPDVAVSGVMGVASAAGAVCAQACMNGYASRALKNLALGAA